MACWSTLFRLRKLNRYFTIEDRTSTLSRRVFRIAESEVVVEKKLRSAFHNGRSLQHSQPVGTFTVQIHWNRSRRHEQVGLANKSAPRQLRVVSRPFRHAELFCHCWERKQSSRAIQLDGEDVAALWPTTRTTRRLSHVGFVETSGSDYCAMEYGNMHGSITNSPIGNWYYRPPNLQAQSSRGQPYGIIILRWRFVSPHCWQNIRIVQQRHLRLHTSFLETRPLK